MKSIRRSDREKDAGPAEYFEVDRKTKTRITLLYFALLAVLLLAMVLAHVTR